MKKCISIILAIIFATNFSLSAMNWQPYVNLAKEKNISREAFVHFYEKFWDSHKKEYMKLVAQEAEKAFDTMRNKYAQPATSRLEAPQIIESVVMYFIVPSLEHVQPTINNWIIGTTEPQFKKQLYEWLSKQ